MKTKLIEIVGIGPTTAKQLVDSGIRTVTILADASIEKIAAIRGFSTNRAELVISAAKRLLDESGVEKSPKIKEKKPVKKDKPKKKTKTKDKAKSKTRLKEKAKAKAKRKSREKTKGKGKGKNKGKGKGKGKGKNKGRK